MKNLWKLNTKTKEKIIQFCLDKKVMAMGWSLTDEHIADKNLDKDAIEKLKNDRKEIKSLDALDKVIRDYHVYDLENDRDYGSLVRLEKEVEIDDLVWMSDNGTYYLGRVCEGSEFKFDNSDAALAKDAANQRDKIDWYYVGNKNAVIKDIYQGWAGYTLKRVNSVKAEEFSKELYNKLSGKEQYKVNNTDLQFYVDKIKNSKNIIFRGAPGTGKTYLARQIALNIVSKGEFSDYASLTKEEKEQFNEQIAFVQFHPSYDYTDFVEGLRPISNDDGNMGFELKDGVFKEFVEKARKNLADSEKSVDDLKRELSVDDSINTFLENVKLGEDTFTTKKDSRFYIVGYNENYIYIDIPDNPKSNKVNLKINKLKCMLNSDVLFEAVKNVTQFFGKKNGTQDYSYLLVLCNKIREELVTNSGVEPKKVDKKDFVFIIDEINRGEISKIFGELFFSIDPGYRGEDGGVLTQYANLHDNAKEKFYIPENVYIIGTMNDIDRSVDTFDFAMRRRFRFIEVKANENIGMLDSLDNNEDVIDRMTSLNNAIEKVAGLNANYQIGASYFLKLKEIHYDYNILWSDYLKPLLEDYVQGMYDAEKIIEKLKAAYNLEDSKGDGNGTAQD